MVWNQVEIREGLELKGSNAIVVGTAAETFTPLAADSWRGGESVGSSTRVRHLYQISQDRSLDSRPVRGGASSPSSKTLRASRMMASIRDTLAPALEERCSALRSNGYDFTDTNEGFSEPNVARPVASVLRSAAGKDSPTGSPKDPAAGQQKRSDLLPLDTHYRDMHDGDMVVLTRGKRICQRI